MVAFAKLLTRMLAFCREFEINSRTLLRIPRVEACSHAKRQSRIVVVPVDDFHKSGLSSSDAEEIRYAQLINALTDDYKVPNIFPFVDDDMWETDNWHFTLDGFRFFVETMARNFKQHLEASSMYHTGMKVYICSDSTFDFHNYGAKYPYNWTGTANKITEEVFSVEGMEVHMDVVGGSGYYAQKGRWCRPFFERIKKYNDDRYCDTSDKAFDVVLVIGGFNDLYYRKRTDEDTLTNAVNDTLVQCLALLN